MAPSAAILRNFSRLLTEMRSSARSEEQVNVHEIAFLDFCDDHGDKIAAALRATGLKAITPPAPAVESGEIERLADRFLAWPLPQSVCSDVCATMQNYAFPRSGTNLLDVAEARQMVGYLLEGLTASPPKKVQWDDEGKLADIRTRAEALPDAEWSYRYSMRGPGMRCYSIAVNDYDREFFTKEEAEFISKARTDIPFLLFDNARLRSTRTAVEVTEEMVERALAIIYADGATDPSWSQNFEMHRGDRHTDKSRPERVREALRAALAAQEGR